MLKIATRFRCKYHIFSETRAYSSPDSYREVRASDSKILAILPSGKIILHYMAAAGITPRIFFLLNS